MLPRLKQWLEDALRDGGATRAAADQGREEALSTFMGDDRLFVAESTITEFSRTVAIYERKPGAGRDTPPSSPT